MTLKVLKDLFEPKNLVISLYCSKNMKNYEPDCDQQYKCYLQQITTKVLKQLEI